MPYISTEHVKRIRDEIKSKFPQYKFSIRRQHSMSVSLSIISGPLDLMNGVTHSYEQVNKFYIKDNYSNFPEKMKLLQEIYEIIDRENGTLVVDSDYGVVPNYYIDISIGEWNKPYIIKN